MSNSKTGAAAGDGAAAKAVCAAAVAVALLLAVTAATAQPALAADDLVPQDAHMGAQADYASGIQAMCRLYNPNSGEHFYTASVNERDGLVNLGWHYEGMGWSAPASSNTPVYRLYNAYGGEHHYTTSAAERDMLVGVGWNDEGTGWYSDDAQAVPLYRLYNPNAFANNHHYTVSADERDWLIGLGWRAESIGWHGTSRAATAVPFENPESPVSVGTNGQTVRAFVGTLSKRPAALAMVEAYYEIQFDSPVTFTVPDASWAKWHGSGTFSLSSMQVAWKPSSNSSTQVDRSRFERLDSMIGERVIAVGRLVPDAGSYAYGTDIIMQESDVYLCP